MAATDGISDAEAAYGTGLTGRAGRSLELVVEWTGLLAMWIILAMVLLISTNVILRYMFAVGPVSLQELEWHLMAPVAMIGSSYTLRHNGHVRVDILYESFRPRMQAFVNLFAAAGLLVASIIVFKLSLNFVFQAYQIGEGSPDPGGLPYRFLLKAVIPFGFALLAMQSAAHVILYAKRVFVR